MLISTLYRGLTYCALPLAKCYLKKRAKKQPEYLEHWDERFGWCDYPTSEKPRLWLHAVSVGETVAARTLIDAFLTENPDAEIFLTCMTPTGRDTGAKIAERYPGRIVQCYLPYDNPRLMRKFFAQTRPLMGIVMETEVWPNMMREAAERKIPVVLANARESEKSAGQARLVASLMAPAFASFAAVLAQSQEDADRLQALGARNIHVCGSVKFDIRPEVAQVKEAAELKKNFRKKVILLASTREGEEMMFAPHLAEHMEEAIFLVVPRHPQRFDEVAEILRRSGCRVIRRSEDAHFDDLNSAPAVLLGDTMGEMSFYCALSDVCIMGGSFGQYGCQNLIEPAASGSPVVVGSSTYNFAKVVADALTAGGAVQAAHPRGAVETALSWLVDGTLAERSRRALEFASLYTGATQRQMQFVREIWANERSKMS